VKNFEIGFQYPLRLLLIIPAMALILVPLFRMQKKRRTLKKVLPAFLRCVTSVLLVIAIAGLQFSYSSSEPAVVLVIDRSYSAKPSEEEIDRAARDICSLIGDGALVASVTFAENHVYAMEFGGDDSKITYSGGLKITATNIQEAVEYAASLFPQDRTKRLVLLTDGRETDGNTEAAAQLLASRGIRVDAWHFDTTSTDNDILMLSAACPAGAQVGDEIPITATIYSSCAAPAVIRLNRSAYELQSQQVRLQEGENTVEFYMPVEEAGKHTYNVTVSAGEQYNSCTRNDIGYCCVNASSSTSILFITNKTSDADLFKQVLSDEYTVITSTPGDCPKTMVELCNYDGVVLMNIDMASLPEGYDAILRDYVELQGRSLLLCGGGSTFMYGNMVGTELEEAMPVTFTVTEESKGDSIGLMILLDTSLSMAGDYITMAKEGAIKCIEALSSKDYVGLVTFNQFASMKAELSPATEVFKQQVAESISSMSTMNQTIYTRPLQMAYEQLSGCDAPVRMAILLSDGGPADTTYSAVARKMAAEGITVSTIGMGFPSTLLAALAQDGCGHFSYATTADDLPEIMLGEAEQQAMSAVQLGLETLTITEDNPVTEGYTDADLPVIDGYMPTALKEGCTAWITTSSGAPIYAVNEFGSGKAAVFTSDLTDRWCSDWYGSQAAADIINRLFTTTLSPEHHGSAMTADITTRGKTISVVLHTAGSNVPVTAEIQVANVYGSHTIPMNAAQRNTFKCSFTADREGAYDATFALKDSAGNVVDYLNSFFSVDYSAEYDTYSSDGRSLLDLITSQTGGIVSSEPSELASQEAPDTTVYLSPVPVLAALCTLLLLADIAIRKLRWADIRGMFRKE